ncbi:rho GTPase-activating protein 24-like [Rhinatrema bivittatum]|uniref:rho GTPase-activating protein 24-like n=1 Tax=Rhinatrema bivittatum TaxID=194408 RepID=UPI00112882ED|nr:rho GTPase-activating protein 24-like [Rhinatrema bivittatum]
MDSFQLFQKLQAAVMKTEVQQSRGKYSKHLHTRVKLSLYDNAEIDPLLISEDMKSVHTGSWSSSSCENMLEENSSSCHSPGAIGHEEDLDASRGIQDNLGHGAVSKSSSEVFSSPLTKVLYGVLFVGLNQQISKQKADYEAKIKSLEQENDELQLEIEDLHSNLEQQRKWYGIVEIKMRNAERAKEDAERRNEMLQQEMEKFFDTFRDLTNEVKKTEQIVQNF